ncbi:unnamed protein product, partial [Protopolystoma xenopodis]
MFLYSGRTSSRLDELGHLPAPRLAPISARLPTSTGILPSHVFSSALMPASGTTSADSFPGLSMTSYGWHMHADVTPSTPAL